MTKERECVLAHGRECIQRRKLSDQIVERMRH